MSKQVDNRVVSMEFDNKRFEKNVATSLSTLDKLKQGLKLTGATKGLEAVDSAAKKLDFSTLNRACETVTSRFSALGVMGVTALANITNSAVNAGKQMVKALTIDPIKTGFSEYETQINAIQTILANTESKGSTLQDVNNALAELNTYADKTIYNFTEMTRNIGTFTAAGVDLKTATSAIKGIANLAAVSGSTSQQASTAMYQLSQAMASGTVKLMDWNSVVNAGMGGQVFQDALKETARVHKINIDQMIKDEGSFRETLQRGWLTTDILTETLSKFTGDLNEQQLKQMGYTDKQIAAIVKMGKTANDAATKVKTFTQLFDTLKEAAQSGWTKTWEIIVGDFGEAKDLLTEISDTIGAVIGSSADSRNGLLSGALSTGWKQLLNEGITDAAGFEERVTEVAKKHGVDVSKMINDETTFQDALKKGWMTTDILSESITAYGAKLTGMSQKQLEAAGYTMKDVEAFKELEKKIKDGTVSLDEFVTLIGRKSGRELLIEALRNAIKGLMNVLAPVKDAFREIFPPTTAAQLYGLIQKITEFTSKLTLSEARSENLKRTFKGLFAVLDIGVMAVKAIAGGLMDLIAYIAPAGDGILGFTAGIGDYLVNLRNAIKEGNLFGKVIEKVGAFLKKIEGFLKLVGEGLKTFGKSVSDSFNEIMGKAEVRFAPLTALGNALKAIFAGLGKIIAKSMPAIVNIASAIGSIFTSLMDKISSTITNANFDGFSDLVNSGIFAGVGVAIMKFIKSAKETLDNFDGFLDKIKEIFNSLTEAINTFTESIKIKMLKDIAIALGILAASLFVIAMIDSEKLTASLGAMAAMFGELIGAMTILSKVVGKMDTASMSAISGVMKKLATTLLIMAVALKIMGSMSWQEMGVGLISMTAALGALVGAIRLLPEKDVKSAAKAIKKLSSAMVVFAIALKIMGSMSWGEMGVGLVSMAAGLTMMVAATKLLPEDASKRAAGMMGLATSMVVLGAALKIMGSMSWAELGVGLTAMASGLVLMVAAVNLLPEDAALKTLGMVGFATALVIMAGALKVMGSMSWKEMGVALITLAGSLTVITVAMNFMKSALPGAGAMLLIAGALAILAPILKTFASMSIGEIAKSLGMLAGVFAVLGLAGYILAPVVGVIAKLAGSIALIGVGVLVAGVGVLALATGITALGGALGVLGAGIATFVASIISLFPFIVKQIGAFIVSIFEAISGAAGAIFSAVTVIVVALVDALVTCIPTIVEGVLKLIVGLLEILIEYLPQIVPLLVTLLVNLIDLMIGHIPTIVEAVFRFLGALLTAAASNIHQLIAPMVMLFGALFEGIAAVIGPVVESVIAPLLEVVLKSFVELFEVLEPHIPMICGLIAFLATTTANAIIKIFEILAPYMPEVTRIVEVVSDAVVKITECVVRLFEQISPILESISNVITSVGESINTALGGVADIIDSVGGVIKTWFDGISKVIDSVGNAALNAGTGFEKLANGVKIITDLGIADLAASLAAVATGLGKITKHADNISTTGEGMKKIADSIKVSHSSLSSMSAAIASMTTTLSELGPTATTTMSTLTSAMSTATDSLSKIASSISTSTASITAATTAMGTACVTVIRGFKAQIALAAGYMMDGMASGIRASKPKATSAAREVAKAVESIIRSAWQVNSPSKLFYKIALGVGEGIEYAFGDSVLGVKRSANELADTATGGFNDAVQKIAEFISSDMSAQPTIRPVLDLSGVRSGADSIASMLGGDRALSISAPNVGAISASMFGRQNGNDGLVSAINKLAKNSGKTGDTYNFNGLSYSESSDVAGALQTLVRAAKMEGRT